jgi:hypothetical protein
VRFPSQIVVQAHLSPPDYFEPVAPSTPRSCLPTGSQHVSYLFDANSGRIVGRSPTVFAPLSVTFDINNSAWSIIFQGRIMQLTQAIERREDIDVLLTHFKHSVPALLSVATGLAVVAETVELAIGDGFEARIETLVPPIHFRRLNADDRIDELYAGIKLIGFGLSSARYVLACSYLREAMLFDARYGNYNPYELSLLVVLKCAHAVEILFGGSRDDIRRRCREIGVPEEVIEPQIIPIVLVRNTFGSAHASAFVPSPRQADVLREFAARSTRVVRRLLLHISDVPAATRAFLDGAVMVTSEKAQLLLELERHLATPLWSCDGDTEVRHIAAVDPRFGDAPH